MPFDKIHHITPTAIMPIIDSVVRMFMKFWAVRNVLVEMVRTAHIASSTSQIEFCPIIFFMFFEFIYVPSFYQLFLFRDSVIPFAHDRAP